jgi:adenine deaminase
MEPIFDLAEFIQQLPKTGTHLHLEGSLPLELARRLDPVKFAQPPPYWHPDFRFHDFAEFQEQFDRYFFRWFVSPENYYESCKIAFERLVAQNCVYLEASFHLGIAEAIMTWIKFAASPPDLTLANSSLVSARADP